jgi:acetoin utilization deacetylase AcuC-like enzyme
MLKIAWHPTYKHNLPSGHRFPMEKYELIPEQLIYENSISAENLHQPDMISDEFLELAHSSEYIDKLNHLNLSAAEIRKTGFPLSQALIDREKIIMQGTVDCALFALEHGVSMNVAGGTHHAFADRGEGFCLLNDMAIASQYLLHQKLAHQILVVDLDVHQGNGTASIFQNNDKVFTFSMHGRHNYPLHKEKSDMDIELEDGTDDSTYLHLLERNFPEVLGNVSPDFVFYQSGVDILSTDKLGRLKVSREGCKKRDRIVIEGCYESKIPLCISMGGGYSERIADIVEAHCNTFRLAQEIFF